MDSFLTEAISAAPPAEWDVTLIIIIIIIIFVVVVVVVVCPLVLHSQGIRN